ncbi:MAG: glycerol-3-phosphate responsive antiterminator [Eubacterium sp.]|nr:glycerol-3-phosphate responsive antiterminator [Eubacterium sp.]
MKQELYDALSDNPIIMAIKDENGLRACLKRSDAMVVFVLFGEVASIAQTIERLKASGKQVMVHMDLISGLSSREEAVDFIAQYTKADGIISTRYDQIKRGRQLGLSTVYRIFVIDSKALSNLNRHIGDYADIVEILPGLMPKIIKKMKKQLGLPIIAGGLIADKEDVIQALDAGAIAISTTNENVWNM